MIDCPGSIGFAADGARGDRGCRPRHRRRRSRPGPSAACSSGAETLDELGIPHLIFVNRIDQARGRIRDLLTALQPISVSPLIARQIPIRPRNRGAKITGFVDLALERAFHYNGKDSEQIEIPGELQQREHEARNQMLEQLADHDDELLEQLLMDQTPDQDRILKDLARETSESLGVPVLFGSAESGWGIGRLLKALRHETPAPQAAAGRLEVGDPALSCVQDPQWRFGRAAGACPRAWRPYREGSDLKTGAGGTARLGALFLMQGDKTHKVAQARSGDVVAVAKNRPGKGRRVAEHRRCPAANRTRLPPR
jgi:elongation factor G